MLSSRKFTDVSSAFALRVIILFKYVDKIDVEKYNIFA